MSKIRPYQCYAWLGPDGKWGIIAAGIPSIGYSLLTCRSKDLAEKHLGPIAAAHGKASGNQVRLVHLVEAP